MGKPILTAEVHHPVLVHSQKLGRLRLHPPCAVQSRQDQAQLVPFHLAHQGEALRGDVCWRKGGAGSGSEMGRQVSSQDSIPFQDRKSTRLNSSHGYISYAVF